MTNTFATVTALLLTGRRGLTLPELAAAGAISRELDSGRNREDRLDQLCRKAGTTVRALEDHFSGHRRDGSGDQLSMFGGSGAGPVPVDSVPHGSDPCARAASRSDRDHAQPAA